MLLPPPRRDDTVDIYHDTSVADPYRWLEDDLSPEAQNWMAAQNAITRAYLDAIPVLERLKTRYTELKNAPRCGSVPQKKGDRYYFRRDGKLYVQRRLDAEAKLVLDPDIFGSNAALASWFVSDDGRLLAYGISYDGSDWQELRVLHVDGERDYDEVLWWCKFTNVAWQHDGSGFYYNRLSESASEGQRSSSKIYWHTLGTPQSADVLVDIPDSNVVRFTPSMTDDGRYLRLRGRHGADTRKSLYIRSVNRAETNDTPFVCLLDKAHVKALYVGNDDDLFYIWTDEGAPRGRIIAIDMRQPEREHWREIIPEQEDVIARASCVNQHFVLVYLHDASHRLMIYRKDGHLLREVALPTLGSIIDLEGKADESELFVQFTSYFSPPTIYRYDFTTDELTLFRTSQLKFDASEYETKQVFYLSKDGTRVPMFLTHKKGVALSGNNPLLLSGYGGFRNSLTPSFDITPLIWVENGGVYAVSNIRGGNEYGEEWHRAGMLEKKQNVFDDFIAAAEWLIENKYTSTKRLAISGSSNGGLLVAACMVQRPDLYGAVICDRPVIDMLRYHKFTVGRHWVPEYGNAEENPEHFQFLYAYSPLHNVREGVSYPPTLILTADTDDRVVPGHARKFAAMLQAANGGENPVLLRVERRAGHGMDQLTAAGSKEQCDVLAFLCKVLEVFV